MSSDTDSAATSSDMARAEEIVDDFAQKAGEWTARLGHQAAKMLALAREEAEDIVAEARSMSERPQA